LCDTANCDCGDHGLKIEGFVVPCILFLLREKPSHGYEIMEKLADLPFFDLSPDPSVVYRHLRRLEDEGKVASQLEPGSGGPARKVYSMTPEGEDYLHMWAAKIRHRKTALDKFIEAYEKIYPERNCK
jgi:PadR family transcriptional regulator, regulatory protein PadR